MDGIMTPLHPIDRLAKWYLAQCNGDWEHTYGIEIGTLDNPGWNLLIDLDDTALESVPFDAIEDGLVDAPSWKRCWREGTKFKAACSPGNLPAVIEIFADWAEHHSLPPK